MIPLYIKHITVYENNDFTYNVTAIADLSDGETIYEDCELVIPREAIWFNNLVMFPYCDEDDKAIVTIALPEEYTNVW